jgi:hypothetical protein
MECSGGSLYLSPREVAALVEYLTDWPVSGRTVTRRLDDGDYGVPRDGNNHRRIPLTICSQLCQDVILSLRNGQRLLDRPDVAKRMEAIGCLSGLPATRPSVDDA